MNYSKTLTVYSESFVKDEYGGGSYSYAPYSQINCATAPITNRMIDTIAKESEFQTLKVFTKDKIDINDFILEYKDKKYKKVSSTDYDKVIMYVMELI